jgi:cytidylate kinase
MTIPVLTLDGPSGVGKGTAAMLAARQLGWHLLDSGAIYRVLGHAARERRIALDDEPGLAALALHLELDFRPAAHLVEVFWAGQAVSQAIRSEEAGKAASRVAALPSVRQALLARQRAFRQAPGLVADGRDMGTVVFPDAMCKIFLTASAEERARRRWKQLREQGITADLAALAREIAERDARDSQRAVAPLEPARDALIIDTSALDIPAVLARIMDAVGKVGQAV